MKKKIRIISCILGVVCLLSGMVIGVSRLIKDYKQDVENTKQMIVKINDETQKFEEKIEEYNKSLTKFIKLLNESNYYEKIMKNNKQMVTLLDEITAQINEINSFEIAKSECLKKYADGKVTRACNSYSNTYEKSINIYVDITKAYNNLITKCNDLFNDDKNIELYTSTITEYIDYDKDGEFSGKNITDEGNLEYEKK